MRVYTRIVLDMTRDDLPVIDSESFEYSGEVALCMPSDGAGGRSGGDGDRGSGGSSDSERGGGSEGRGVGNRTASRGGYAKEDAIGGLAQAAGINKGRELGGRAGAAIGGLATSSPLGGIAGYGLGSVVGASIGGMMGAAKDREVLGGKTSTGVGGMSGGSVGDGSGIESNREGNVLTFSNGMKGTYSIPKSTYDALKAAAAQSAATQAFLNVLNAARAKQGNSGDLIARHNENVDSMNTHSAKVFGDGNYASQEKAVSLQTNPNPKQYDTSPTYSQRALSEIENAKRLGAKIYVQ